jgi:uncharacterized damage-inducible protein DinB
VHLTQDVVVSRRPEGGLDDVSSPPGDSVGTAYRVVVGTTRQDVIALSEYVYGRTRRRLDGLTDDEYLWEPVPGCWSLRADAAGVMRADHAVATDDPPPFTTIAWRLWHLIGCYGAERNAQWLGASLRRPGFDSDDPAPATAAGAIGVLEGAHETWHAVLTALPDEQWSAPLGRVAGFYADDNKASFVLHQIDEQIHHGGELGVLRDLYHHGFATGMQSALRH